MQEGRNAGEENDHFHPEHDGVFGAYETHAPRVRKSGLVL